MATDAHLIDIEPVQSDAEAEARAKLFKQLDPFPDIKPALLSASDIEDYARVTAMLFPFYASAESLKPASYEVRPGRKFVRWDEDGRRIELEITENGSFELPPNSISFIQIEPKIRLPDYIAIRFNLRITHVHRGLLLGTGPLIDPGFSGVPLIPLHNLTSESYRIRGNEGLIWVEFTKTAPEIVNTATPSYARRGSFHPLEPRKTDRDVDYYFYAANRLQPIRSSIPGAIRNAEKSAASARAASRVFAGIGILAILAVVVALLALFAQIYGNFHSTIDLAGTVSTKADQAKAESSQAIADSQAIRQELGTVRMQMEDLRGQLGAAVRELERLRSPAPIPTRPTK